MGIQSSINQAINLGGLLYTQTGEYKAKQEEIFKKKEITKAEEATKQASKAAIQATKGAVDSNASTAARSLAAEAYKDSAEAYKNLYKLDPTEMNLAAATGSRDMADLMQRFADKKYKIEPYNPNKAKEANQKAADRVNAMSEQKESAKRYMMLLKEDKE